MVISQSNLGNIWDDILTQGGELADELKSALTPDSWTTATRILPWAIGGMFLLMAVKGLSSGGRR